MSINASPIGFGLELAGLIANTRYEELSPYTIHMVKRGLLDWLGCAISGSDHDQVKTLINVLRKTNGSGNCPVIGTTFQLGSVDAALVNAQMGHVHDFDDTHDGAVFIHLSSPLLSALLSISNQIKTKGIDFILAYVIGFEIAVRLGRSAPGHHRRGWHPTGTLGSIGAAAACAKLLKLNARQTLDAMGIAISQCSGLQQNRGTACKSFHSGKAASNGVLAAALAMEGFDSSLEIIEGAKGFLATYSDVSEPTALIVNFGKTWEVDCNGFKPYACGLVLHPVIDGVLSLRSHVENPDTDVDRIDLRVNPYVLSITGDPAPPNGLRSKFSVHHSVAVALIDGMAGLAQYETAKVLSPNVMALRTKVYAIADDSIKVDQAEVSITVRGVLHKIFINHATGTSKNPMDDKKIEEKFIENVAIKFGELRCKKIINQIWNLDILDDTQKILRI
jgi:2-methylcitrate dehydratase PrpD